MLEALLLTVLAAAGSCVAVGLVRRELDRRAILDHPNARSSHTRPTPRGGGIGLLAVLLPLWLGLTGMSFPALLLPLAAAGLALVGLADDVWRLPAGPRLLAQLAAVLLGLAALPDPVLGLGLPALAERALAGLGWLWFINLFNFMDGIDGIAGVEAASLGLGLALVGALTAEGDPLLGLIVAGAALGFLVWNWHPARIFLGDVGSVPLGYLLGFLCLEQAQAAPAAALLLPLAFVADASLTLLRRLAAGQLPWAAHREHFYQRAVAGGRRHDPVALAFLAANLGLIALATLAAAGRVPQPAALAGGAGIILVLLLGLGRAARRR